MGIVESILRMIFMECPSDERHKRNPHEDWEIKVKMPNPDVVVMDFDSFRKSKVVKQQFEAAKRLSKR